MIIDKSRVSRNPTKHIELGEFRNLQRPRGLEMSTECLNNLNHLGSKCFKDLIVPREPRNFIKSSNSRDLREYGESRKSLEHLWSLESPHKHRESRKLKKCRESRGPPDYR